MARKSNRNQKTLSLKWTENMQKTSLQRGKTLWLNRLKWESIIGRDQISDSSEVLSGGWLWSGGTFGCLIWLLHIYMVYAFGCYMGCYKYSKWLFDWYHMHLFDQAYCFISTWFLKAFGCYTGLTMDDLFYWFYMHFNIPLCLIASISVKIYS